MATPAQRADLEAELADRFGPLPPSVSNLLDYALLKNAAEQLLVQTVERKEDEIWMKFHESAPLDPHQVLDRSIGTPACAGSPDTGRSACATASLRRRERDGGLITQVQKVLQELHPSE